VLCLIVLFKLRAGDGFFGEKARLRGSAALPCNPDALPEIRGLARTWPELRLICRGGRHRFGPCHGSAESNAKVMSCGKEIAGSNHPRRN
jgi:hypothetical protein